MLAFASRCLFLILHLRQLFVLGENTVEARGEFTVLMNVYGRQGDIAPWLSQYLEHPQISFIVLQTKNGFVPNVTDMGVRLGKKVSNVIVVAFPRNSLSDRFLPVDFASKYVLVVDDDLLGLPREVSSTGEQSCRANTITPHFEDLFDHR